MLCLWLADSSSALLDFNIKLEDSSSVISEFLTN